MEKTTEDLLKLFCPPSFLNSFFFSFEGIEGSGKSTQIHKFKAYLESKGFRTVLLREPGGTEFGEKLRQAILKSKTPLSPIAEAHLFAASRAQLLEEIILKELQKANTAVICDRYIDSSLAYQGEARSLGLLKILEIHSHYPLTTVPHLTFYLKISLETSMHRQLIRNNPKDYFESEQGIFHQKLIDGYQKAHQLFSNRIKVIDGEKDQESVTKNIVNEVKDLFE